MILLLNLFVYSCLLYLGLMAGIGIYRIGRNVRTIVSEWRCNRALRRAVRAVTKGLEVL